MKQLVLLILCATGGHFAMGQTYISVAPELTNDPGTMAGKSNISLEVGRQWDVFSMGADIGRTTMAKVDKRDTSLYLEFRPNLNIFQQGKFTNTLTLGIGGIFNAKENFMTEFTTGIEYAYSPLYHFNMNFGQYYYSGLSTASTVTFFGISVMRYFKPTKTGALLQGKCVAP